MGPWSLGAYQMKIDLTAALRLFFAGWRRKTLVRSNGLGRQDKMTTRIRILHIHHHYIESLGGTKLWIHPPFSSYFPKYVYS